MVLIVPEGRVTVDVGGGRVPKLMSIVAFVVAGSPFSGVTTNADGTLFVKSVACTRTVMLVEGPGGNSNDTLFVVPGGMDWPAAS